MDEHDEPDLIPCPHCRKMIIEDAEQCHHCRQWVDERSSAAGLSTIIIFIIAALIIAVTLGWVFR
jgi:uncharacterized protein (DUF983 family)